MCLNAFLWLKQRPFERYGASPDNYLKQLPPKEADSEIEAPESACIRLYASGFDCHRMAMMMKKMRI